MTCTQIQPSHTRACTHTQHIQSVWSLKLRRGVKCVTLCSTSVYNKLSGQCPWKRFLHSSTLPSLRRGESDRGMGGAGRGSRGEVEEKSSFEMCWVPVKSKTLNRTETLRMAESERGQMMGVRRGGGRSGGEEGARFCAYLTRVQRGNQF